MQLKRSEDLFGRSKRYIPGGVNSPVRAYRSVGGVPLFIDRAEGPYIYDVDGNRYIDLVGSWGPMILGHAREEILGPVMERMRKGSSFGAPTEGELLLAEMIIERVPGIDMVRLVNSGTEATMSALRLARAVTGRDKVIKFEGSYHGHADAFLIAAGSGAATLGVPDSPGVTAAAAADTLTAPFNDVAAVKEIFEREQGSIACVIVEGVNGNTGTIGPKDGYLRALRELCHAHGALLVLDEVMTGFRVARGGVQERYGVDADILTFGKIIGGGFPIGAYGARQEIMEMVAPAGPVYQAGTLSGNPVAVQAGIETLRALTPELYIELEKNAAYFENAIREMIAESPMDLTFNRVGSMFTLFFHPGPIMNNQDVNQCDMGAFAEFFHSALEKGIYYPPSQYEAAFLSIMHDKEILNSIISVFKQILM